MSNIINKELCKNCKLCIEICPCNILAENDKDETYFIPAREAICIKCGQCMAVCNNKAIQVEGYSYEKELFDLPKNELDYKAFHDFLATRRSVRNFKDKPVPDDIIKQVVDAVAYAPYGSAPNKVHITVVNNRKAMEKALPIMSAFLDKLVKWVENPIMRFIIKSKKGVETINTLKHHLYPIAKAGNYKVEFADRITRGAPAMLIFHADVEAEEHTDNSMIYAVYAMLAAHSLGLGATMVSLVPACINKVKELKGIFNIPNNHEVVISVILGYQKIKYKRGVKREKEHVKWLD